MNDASSDDLDRQDMARLASGSDSALNGLMERHAPCLFNYLFRILHDESRANDIAQETFVKVYLNRNKFKTDAKFSTWLFAISTNLVRDHLRWKHRHPEISIDVGSEEHQSLADILPDPAATPGEALIRHERVEQVRQAVQALPEDLRTALILAEYEGLSQDEVGVVLGCSRKAVEMRLYRARAILRQTLSTLASSDNAVVVHTDAPVSAVRTCGAV